MLLCNADTGEYLYGAGLLVGIGVGFSIGQFLRYLYELTHNQELTTSILPVGDGVAVSVKDRKEEQL